MDFILSLLKPIFVPLLKLPTSAPHLPEGTSLVRQQKPTEQWLAWRYLTTLFGLFGQFIGAGVAAVALGAAGPLGIAAAVLLMLVECGIIAFALVTVRVDWELRHYLVGNKSLRVVHGALTREETTISYANIQNIEVTQGPLERVFGFKNLTITTAGASATPQGQLSHAVVLAGLSDADELRTVILDMLKAQKDAGLGDPGAHAPTSTQLDLTRLKELATAAKALRAAALEQPVVTP